MQRVLKRTAQAEKQVARRATKKSKQEHSRVKRDYLRNLSMANQEIRNNIENARRARKEDWELGPLAPKRDTGVRSYGAFEEIMRRDYTGNAKWWKRDKVIEKRAAWAGGVKQICLAIGDRVVLLEGPDKGKIDRIKSINLDTATITLEKYQKGLQKSPISETARYEIAMPVSVAAVRLVYPITNPETGITKDTIINQLQPISANMASDQMTHERWEYGIKYDRLAPGTNLVIPWPETKVPEFETTPADTTREQVEDRTFYYNLLTEPMPSSIINELRNQYSKFRTRHEPWYIAKKEAEEARKNGVSNLMQSMQTPLDEFHAKKKELRLAQGEPELSDEMLQKLGEIIAQTKATSLQDAGATEVTPDAKSPSAPTS